MIEPEDQISPAAITHCDMCQVRNGAIGGYTSDRRFVPFYKGDDPEKPLSPKLGRRAWCGRSSPEHILPLQRIVCTPVRTEDGPQNLCQLCAREDRKALARESQGVAA